MGNDNTITNIDVNNQKTTKSKLQASISQTQPPERVKSHCYEFNDMTFQNEPSMANNNTEQYYVVLDDRKDEYKNKRIVENVPKIPQHTNYIYFETISQNNNRIGEKEGCTFKHKKTTKSYSNMLKPKDNNIKRINCSNEDGKYDCHSVKYNDDMIQTITYTIMSPSNDILYHNIIPYEESLTVAKLLFKSQLNIESTDGFIKSIDGIKNNKKDGWIFEVNNKMVMVPSTKYIIKPNECILWKYVNFEEELQKIDVYNDTNINTTRQTLDKKRCKKQYVKKKVRNN